MKCNCITVWLVSTFIQSVLWTKTNNKKQKSLEKQLNQDILKMGL